MPYIIQRDLFGGAEVFKETDEGLVSMGIYLTEAGAVEAKGRLERADRVRGAVERYEQKHLNLHGRGKE